MRSAPACLIGLVASGIACTLLPGLLAAQSVQGLVRDASTSRPVEVFTVDLVDPAGGRIASVLSKPGGIFFVRAPAPGEFRLRISRIGYRRTLSAPFTLATGEVRAMTLDIAQVPTQLAAMRASSDQRCDLAANEASEVATAWDEVRKAVQAVGLAGRDQKFDVSVHDFRRRLTAPGSVIVEEQHTQRNGTSVAPYLSLPPDSVERAGFVVTLRGAQLYVAPDATVLGSDAFLNTHCFSLTRAAPADTGLLGIAFEPARGRRVVEVEGTAWLDRSTYALHHVDYRYANLTGPAAEALAGGRVDFIQISGGSWLIRSWLVRAPVIENKERVEAGGGGFSSGELRAARRVSHAVLAGVIEEGGELLAARSVEGTVLWASQLGNVGGSVRDSTTGEPIVGAIVTLRGTAHVTRTDTIGHYAFRDVPYGAYTLEARVERPSARAMIVSRPLQVSRDDGGHDLRLAARAAAAAAAEATRRDAELACSALRAAREQEIRAAYAVSTNSWHPAGPDSLATATAARRAPTILQAVVDTTGRVDMGTVRALRHGPSDTYRAAMQALSAFEEAPPTAAPGCRLRRLLLLPYTLRRGE
ncbi:MAG: carboxypeptidase regulatory-like domain-containing protein [Gemmatimonadaceae bacterium]|nr:carboxypeptidase regulatory-like domain-containing protein [Gemmatimonadaceae bacterium]